MLQAVKLIETALMASTNKIARVCISCEMQVRRRGIERLINRITRTGTVLFELEDQAFYRRKFSLRLCTKLPSRCKSFRGPGFAMVAIILQPQFIDGGCA